MERGLKWIIFSLEQVLARGHGTIPVPHDDLRKLIEAAKHTLAKPAAE